MNELVIGDKKYVSSKRAAEITGYAKDYIGQLCREGRVEATLVGRSWYVLETSIREHRFGADQPESNPDPVSETLSTWEPTVYESVDAPVVPVLEDKGINLLAEESVFEQPEPAAPTPSVSSVEDMQSAWREWFATREQQSTQIQADAETETPVEPEESPWEPVEIAPIMQEEVLPYDPVPFTKEIEEPVVVHRSYDVERPQEAVRTTIQHAVPTPMLIKRGAATFETSVKSRTTRKQGGNRASKAALIAVSILCVAVALVGAGFADAYIEGKGFEYSMLRFFAGAFVIE